MITASTEVNSERLECDVCIIGSGAGGAAAAWSLSQKGLSVICLEAGGHFTTKDFSQDLGVASRQLYAEDGQRLMTGNLFIPVAGGEALGGSTVVNSGICFRMPQIAENQVRLLNDIALALVSRCRFSGHHESKLGHFAA